MSTSEEAPGAGSGARDATNRVLIFDTTLRDGEQSPGISLNRQEKLEIAHQLARLGVDIVEAGFPITSPGDFESVQAIAREVEGPVICGLARTSKQDIDAAWQAVRDSERPRIHTFLATSDVHIEYKLQTTREDVKGQVRAAVAQARELCEDVEFSPEDGSRSDVEFMAEVIQIALDEGASTINVPDTVGYALPSEYAAMFTELYRLLPDLRNVVVSVHCHDDLGIAVANSLAGLEAGCRQVECAVNGIGERAGNASLEEIAMLLRTREPSLELWTGIETTEIARTSRLVSRLTGYQVQPNKAIVGRNAFAHEAGIHQDGVLKERTTYEIMDAATIGLNSNSLVLGKHSGRHALSEALKEMGFEIDGQALNTAFKRFKEIADRKKQVTAMDLEALVTDELRSEDVGGYAIDWFEVDASSLRPPHAKVSVTLPDGGTATGTFTGDGPIDAIFQAINVASGIAAKLSEFTIGAVTEGQDALGEVSIVLEVDGITGAGQSVSTDIIDAAARAYVRALSVAVARSRAPDAVGLPETTT
ncbi:MAG TPA: 2-isopropylmalate synthase [Solirubrobacteraceae bacterium]|jgi:2-isopropylmalate synthase|nr:2-isopropylmalate synthase [Solirubrobacteraceae bacterium]